MELGIEDAAAGQAAVRVIIHKTAYHLYKKRQLSLPRRRAAGKRAFCPAAGGREQRLFMGCIMRADYLRCVVLPDGQNSGTLRFTLFLQRSCRPPSPQAGEQLTSFIYTVKL
jgi:hypothetical protein